MKSESGFRLAIASQPFVKRYMSIIYAKCLIKLVLRRCIDLTVSWMMMFCHFNFFNNSSSKVNLENDYFAIVNLNKCQMWINQLRKITTSQLVKSLSRARAPSWWCRRPPRGPACSRRRNPVAGSGERHPSTLCWSSPDPLLSLCWTLQSAPLGKRGC